jgi:hypothetical protein
MNMDKWFDDGEGVKCQNPPNLLFEHTNKHA